MPTNKKKLLILLGIVVVIVIIIIVAAVSGQKKGSPSTDNGAVNSPTSPSSETPTNLVNTASGTVNPLIKDAKVVVPGASLISKDNVVVTPEGKPTQNNVVPMTPGAPQQTPPIAAPEKLAASVTKLGISAAGYSPKEVTVKAGAPVTLAVTGTDQFTHVFMFDDAALSAVAVGIGPNETRAISFNAPTKAGDYTFRCDVPGHTGRGEVGKMIVK